MGLVAVIAVATGVLLGLGFAVVALIRRYGKDAVAGRQTIARVPLKHRRW